jgi:anti-sigma factor RsiW
VITSPRAHGMTCRDIEKLLDLFLDGELEARNMRAVALHVTRCEPCERLLQHLERVQDLVVESINEAVADVDFSRLWPGIAARADAAQRSFGGVGERLRAEARRPAVIAAAMAAALLVSVIALWRAGMSLSVPTVTNNQARIDRDRKSVV